MDRITTPEPPAPVDAGLPPPPLPVLAVPDVAFTPEYPPAPPPPVPPEPGVFDGLANPAPPPPPA